MAHASARPLTIGIVAGEASGDQLGAHLMRSLLARRRDLRFVGIGGPRMEAAGADILFPMEKLAPGGSIAALARHREIGAIRRRLRERFLHDRPALFVGVDAPGFNLDLEIALKKEGVPTVQYVGTAIHAWRRTRVQKVKEAVSLLLTVFAFQAKAYEKAGVPVQCVGHPLADLLAELPSAAAVREELRVPLEAPVVALMPGSRAGALEPMAEIFIRTAVRLKAQMPGVRFLAPFATRESKTTFEAALARVRPEGLELTLLIGHTLEAMAAADAVLVASDTDALEAALLKRPMVIACRRSRLSWWLEPRPHLPHAGLPNILAGERIVPELVQNDATPEKLAQALAALMHDTASRAALDSHFEAIRSALRQNTAEKAPAAIMPLLARPRPVPGARSA